MGTMQSVTSGKDAYRLYRKNDAMLFVRSRQTVAKMLRKENELRMSDETQKEYSRTDVECYFTHVKRVNTEIQKKVIREFVPGSCLVCSSFLIPF